MYAGLEARRLNYNWLNCLFALKALGLAV